MWLERYSRLRISLKVNSVVVGWRDENSVACDLISLVRSYNIISFDVYTLDLVATRVMDGLQYSPLHTFR